MKARCRFNVSFVTMHRLEPPERQDGRGRSAAICWRRRGRSRPDPECPRKRKPAEGGGSAGYLGAVWEGMTARLIWERYDGPTIVSPGASARRMSQDRLSRFAGISVLHACAWNQWPQPSHQGHAAVGPGLNSCRYNSVRRTRRRKRGHPSRDSGTFRRRDAAAWSPFRLLHPGARHRRPR
ncbi:hypothetical protein SAMN04488498_102470 [Mesorhizobium albiziae]|uniref:Uncharacterized protein n=1 Tax=Neomesorhizobium albiziae TaxID=335020 RepID=A0A1I3WSL6_9HYPH|nr:hypothetical protein SAMN04488498_102470 [Mesorhizobium albiziae]